MSWLVDLALGLVKTAWELRPTRPYWRWGHSYELDSIVCENCDREDPFQLRVTSPPCPGPSKERADALKAARARRAAT